jgi:hypothetical protein
MGKWKYEGHDSFARPQGGTIEASSMEDAAGKLREAGVFVLKINPSDAPSRNILDGKHEQVKVPQAAPPEPPAPAPAPAAVPVQQKDEVQGDVSIENELEAHCDKVAAVRAWIQSKSKGKKQGKLIVPAIDKDVVAWIEEGLQKATVMAVYEAMRK